MPMEHPHLLKSSYINSGARLCSHMKRYGLVAILMICKIKHKPLLYNLMEIVKMSQIHLLFQQFENGLMQEPEFVNPPPRISGGI